MSAVLTRDPSQHLPSVASPGGAYVIEIGEIAAGILVRDRNAYRFFAADRDFHLLEGSVFHTPQAAQKAAERMRSAVGSR